MQSARHIRRFRKSGHYDNKNFVFAGIWGRTKTTQDLVLNTRLSMMSPAGCCGQNAYLNLDVELGDLSVPASAVSGSFEVTP